MKENGFARYVLFGIGNAAVIFAILILIRPLLHAGETAGQMVRAPENWLISVLGGVAGAVGLWRKNNKV